MLNKLSTILREQQMVSPGERVVCAVSGGADSVALLFAMYLLKDRLDIQLEAAHFNHRLRGEESDADEAFVKAFCERYDIPLHIGSADIVPGAKGLEAAARDARYAFLRSLPGKIATAHTADDNAETVLMHLLRGTGLKGLGAIAPINGRVIRPMLTVTRQDVEDFLTEYCLRHREDSSNAADAFLRNRIRHSVVPLLRAENPSFAQNVSAMALRLRQDEEFFQQQLSQEIPTVTELRQLHPALRSRYLERFLKQSGIPEPEQAHLAMAEALVFSDKPSARADFPGGITVGRIYDRLEAWQDSPAPEPVPIIGSIDLPQWGITLRFDPEGTGITPVGRLVIRSRQPGDTIRLSGGTKSIKKLMIDRKIPASRRDRIAILADDRGVIAVDGIGFHLDRIENNPTVRIRIEKFPTENIGGNNDGK